MAPGTRTLTLPDNGKIRILAVSVAEENPELSQAQPLYDTLNRTEPPNAPASGASSR
jgi:alpha-mannosidase